MRILEQLQIQSRKLRRNLLWTAKTPKGDYQEFLNGEVRYNALMRANPEKAQRLFAQNEAEAMERYEYLKGLVKSL